MIRLIFWTLLANALMSGAAMALRLAARCMRASDKFALWCRRAERQVDVGIKREMEKTK
jgi:DNA polymerase IIIc chi subunit